MAKKLLNGSELAAFIKNRQAKQVRMLRQAHHIFPKLVVIKSLNASPVIDSYVRLKNKYAQDILIDFEVISCQQADMAENIKRANSNDAVQAIVVQLPLDDPTKTDEIVNLIDPGKDVDGLGKDSTYVSATAEAIDWLLSGYGVELSGKRIVVAGRGRLVGAPLIELWKSRDLSVKVVDSTTQNVDQAFLSADVIVSATGQPGLLTDTNVPRGAIVVDAGTASEDGKILGDSDPRLQARQDLIITPPKGGVGPLTVAVMFDHVIRAALQKIEEK